jgi:hypothetical protein
MECVISYSPHLSLAAPKSSLPQLGGRHNSGSN